jgi:hypothetical protein
MPALVNTFSTASHVSPTPRNIIFRGGLCHDLCLQINFQKIIIKRKIKNIKKQNKREKYITTSSSNIEVQFFLAKYAYFL